MNRTTTDWRIATGRSLLQIREESSLYFINAKRINMWYYYYICPIIIVLRPIKGLGLGLQFYSIRTRRLNECCQRK